MLFSEPKIPQSERARPLDIANPSFSALQRAENSSIEDAPAGAGGGSSFSALQRAENSSIVYTVTYTFQDETFQCSSASRKFLNSYDVPSQERVRTTFQCSSASRKFLNIRRRRNKATSARRFQCSSASRKFLNRHHQDLVIYYFCTI